MAAKVLKRGERKTLAGVGAIVATLAVGLAVATGNGLYPAVLLGTYLVLALLVYQSRLQRNELAELRGELQGMLFVHQLLQPGQPLPKSSNASISWEAAALLVSEVMRRKPGLVVELGSGVSTVLVAEALRRLGRGRIVTIEHDAFWADSTHNEIVRRGLQDIAEARHAPLETLEVDGQARPWYATGPLQDLADIDLLIVDGPPRRVADMARYPALPFLRERLAADCLVFVDDAGRDDEARMLARWQEQHPISVDLRQTPTGTALVELRASPAIGD